jgi:magnesium-transporting ATPase (P-type)
MKKIGLLIAMILLSSVAFADKELVVKYANNETPIVVILFNEEYKAMSVMTQTPEEWANNAVKNKAQKMLNELVEKYSDKQVAKMTETEKKTIIDSIDIKTEKESRNIKINK